VDKNRSLLIINVGSTSTKVACYRGEQALARDTIVYHVDDLARYASLADQLPRREQDVIAFLDKHGIETAGIDMIVSRGGLGRPAPAGAYRVDEAMCRDLLEGTYGKHPSALGPAMAFNISNRYGIPAIVVDPPSTDELEPLARVSGIPEIERKSAFHALNQKSAARWCAAGMGKAYEEINVIVAHLGGGITIGAHRKGRVIDCTHGLAEGPFTPERAGALPTIDLLEMVFSGKMDRQQIERRLVGEGGLAAYLGTTDARNLEERVRGGDEEAERIFESLAYQIAKDIAAMGAVLAGEVDRIVLTGGLARSTMLTDWVGGRVRFIAPVVILPGEDEMQALADGGVRVLRNEESVKSYLG